MSEQVLALILPRFQVSLDRVLGLCVDKDGPFLVTFTDNLDLFILEVYVCDLDVPDLVYSTSG